MAGPFDLGTVVVRVALFLDPKTAQVRTVTDPIPHVYGGTLLDLRAVSVKIDRPGFSLNGTNCTAVRRSPAILHGGGANPDRPGGVQLVRRELALPGDRLRRAADFGPKLYLRTFGGDEAGQEPETEGDPRRPPGRRQHRPRRGHPAEVDPPRPGARSPKSAPGSSSRPTSARRTRSTASPKRTRRCSTARSKARSTCAPPTTRCPTWSPPCTARSTSSSPAAPTRSTAGSATPSTSSPTCRSRNSR